MGLMSDMRCNSGGKSDKLEKTPPM